MAWTWAWTLVALPPPGLRILVTLLLDTLPMLGNVLLLCFFIFFIFGIVGVQLWAGILRQRCFFDRGKFEDNATYKRCARRELAGRTAAPVSMPLLSAAAAALRR